MSDHASRFLSHPDYHGGVVHMSADTYAALVRERDVAREMLRAATRPASDADLVVWARRVRDLVAEWDAE